jgi:hypothetical protein
MREPWGCRFQLAGSPHRPQAHRGRHQDPGRLAPDQTLSPTTGAFGEQLQALRLIKEGLGGEVPFVETIFTPLSVAGRLVSSDEVMREHLGQYRERVHEALEAITLSFEAFARACLEVGVDGLFYATTDWATYDRLTDAEYEGVRPALRCCAYSRPWKLLRSIFCMFVVAITCYGSSWIIRTGGELGHGRCEIRRSARSGSASPARHRWGGSVDTLRHGTRGSCSTDPQRRRTNP